MNIKKLTEQVSVTPQISSGEIQAIKDAGFKSIINNRPNFEAPDQPVATELAQQIKEAGLEAAWIPMVPGQFLQSSVIEMVEALDKLPKPILAFCASGTRSTILWCCANVIELGTDKVLKTASGAGYDLEQIRPLLDDLPSKLQ